MFLFIAEPGYHPFCQLNISIHLMFLFITFSGTSCFPLLPFQYISCSYSSRTARPPHRCISQISIHLMFLFIFQHYSFGTKTPKFQYISCSYSSSSAVRVSELCQHFNTSHVLIHRCEGGIHHADV